ncbi:hypothetical protein P280DRAFT_471054 [Massarina eburnea CBS 473.64]|uniref:Uncharacterized protein n=1 Tax=Massarina eburnea CBS 473.64 TaxID=1395130 RepID=A0A6A6RU38_9PLEO|nr:hypothetical protein P280DRAFT_471054 [Massarina eburnea CBS 473.64]
MTKRARSPSPSSSSAASKKFRSDDDAAVKQSLDNVTVRNAEQSPLLRLPVELRDQIYSYLPQRALHAVSTRKFTMYYPRLHFADSYVTVCRQICSELRSHATFLNASISPTIVVPVESFIGFDAFFGLIFNLAYMFDKKWLATRGPAADTMSVPSSAYLMPLHRYGDNFSDDEICTLGTFLETTLLRLRKSNVVNIRILLNNAVRFASLICSNPQRTIIETMSRKAKENEVVCDMSLVGGSELENAAALLKSAVMLMSSPPFKLYLPTPEEVLMRQNKGPELVDEVLEPETSSEYKDGEEPDEED